MNLLKKNINNSVEIIDALDTLERNEYPEVGIIEIDTEKIYYQGTTDRAFKNCIRGYDGTTAAAHLAGATITNIPIPPETGGGTPDDLSVTPAKISNTPTDDFVFPGDLAVVKDNKVILGTGTEPTNAAGESSLRLSTDHDSIYMQQGDPEPDTFNPPEFFQPTYLAFPREVIIMSRCHQDATGDFSPFIKMAVGHTHDIEFVTDGVGSVKLPFMTSGQRDALTSMSGGSIIYNFTTNKINFWNGSAWRALDDSAV